MTRTEEGLQLSSGLLHHAYPLPDETSEIGNLGMERGEEGRGKRGWEGASTHTQAV